MKLFNSPQAKHDTHPLTIAIVRSIYDNQITTDKVQQVTWSEFKQELLNEHDVRDTKDGIAVIPCGFFSCSDEKAEIIERETDESGDLVLRRCAENVTEYTMLVIDIDDGASVDEIVEFFSEYECVVASSHNHMVDDVVKVRVYLPLITPVPHEEIRRRKNKLMAFLPNPDPCTFGASRAFLLPSVPLERQQYAFIEKVHGELFDVMQFAPDEDIPIPSVRSDDENEPLTPQVRELIIRELKNVGRIEYDTFYKLAASMHNSGFSLHDFLEVAPTLKPAYSNRAVESQWWYSQQLKQLQTGTLIHLLNELGIKIPGLAKKAKKQLNNLNRKLEKAKQQLEKYLERNDLSDDEREEKEEFESLYNSLLDKKEAVLKAENEANNRLNHLLDNIELYYVADVDKLLEYKPDQGTWLDYKIPAFLNHYPFISDAGGKQLLMMKLEERGALRKTVCISAKPQPNYVLNKFRKDHWVQPSKGEYHEIFDIFIRSLGDTKQENIDHIKEVVAWKYLHPEDYSLPCLVIYGQGGAGKTSFVTTLLATIFGKHQVIAVQQDAMKNFNGVVAGKVAVSLEESVWDKADKNHLKAIIGQRTVMVNEKYGRQYDADNVSLYVVGGNGALGAVRLGRDQSDRRFSILKVTRSIIDHVMIVKSLKRDDAIEWWERNKKHLENKEQVACWLGSIIPLVEDMETPPVALHGKDYQALLKAQAGPFEEIVDLVFDQPQFEFINGKEVYELYQLLCVENGYGRPMVKSSFDSRLENELTLRHPHIKFRTVKVIDLNGKPTTNRGWVLDSLSCVERKHYFVIDHEHIRGKRIINEKPFSDEYVTQNPSHQDLMDE
ncbi:DUF5906 domain-containing protein [Salinimonas iocasae]|uniref:NrS-1 polymerase-like helicase domain-containing protein n=1 Tax=Salinimonas iocasae TaxID=2572577 RepID=A0A5B7Y9R8_9ALTE|nr:DUF5906 domain-containing protein [Salinimonas iocasae]QCZ92180.1 hypothetical protein FBQ74_01235 [Salinimonas iocasae]